MKYQIRDEIQYHNILCIRLKIIIIPISIKMLKILFRGEKKEDNVKPKLSQNSMYSKFHVIVTPHLIAMYIFTIFFLIHSLEWPKRGYGCCVSFNLKISLMYEWHLKYYVCISCTTMCHKIACLYMNSYV
jgi:hypothetical protein